MGPLRSSHWTWNDSEWLNVWQHKENRSFEHHSPFVAQVTQASAQTMNL